MAKRADINLVALILKHVAELEGWDAEHASIEQLAESGWLTMANGDPMPSAALLTRINQSLHQRAARAVVERRLQVRK